MARGWIVCLWRIVLQSPIWRPNMVRPVGSSRLMMKPLRYLRNTGREEDVIALVVLHAKENGLARCDLCARLYRHIELDMGTIVPVISGPKRPQDYGAFQCKIRLQGNGRNL